MTDSSSFSSLLALVDSHLSKVCLTESRSEDGKAVSGMSNPIAVPAPGGSQAATLSDTSLSFSPGQRLPIPDFKFSQNTIQNVLAEQVANMLKMKEQKKLEEEEKQKLAEEKRRSELEEEECVVDLMKALQMPHTPGPPIKEEVLSSSSSFESLFEPKFIDCDNSVEVKSPEPLLPCMTDISHILKQKVWRGKCSTFGKVLAARWNAAIVPYDLVRERRTDLHYIEPFDFSTPSPCDIIKAKLRKPTCNQSYKPDILGII